MCRRGLHDLSDPSVVRHSAKGRFCGPCADAASIAKHGATDSGKPKGVSRAKPRSEWKERTARAASVRRRVCVEGHDLNAVGTVGRRCAVCRETRIRHCREGHVMVGYASGGSGCRECDNLRKRSREHVKRARHHGAVVLNTKATGWRSMIDGKACAYCTGCPATTLDHIVPLSRGGAHSNDNLAPACVGCNSSKSGRLLSEWRGRNCPNCGTYSPYSLARARGYGVLDAYPTHVERGNR
jgi:5-methylcytosine-specific restriction endonuclease McrA